MQLRYCAYIKEYYPDIDEGIYLWGAGKYGTLMLKYLIQNGIIVKGVIDNDLEKIGILCENIAIVSFSDIEDDNQNIFITIESEAKVTEVQKQIYDTYPNISILKLSDLSDKLFEKYAL